MKKVYASLILLLLVVVCNAQNGSSTEFQIRHGILMDANNTKLTLDLEVMLKATLVNGKIQSTAVVGYRCIRGQKWADIEQYFNNQDADGWVKVEFPAYPFVPACNSLINADDIPITIKQVLRKSLKYNEQLPTGERFFCLFSIGNCLVFA